MTEKVNIKDVMIGNRYRKDLGYIQGLMESISRQGLLMPIIIDDKNNLISGARRLQACRKLGWVKIDAIVVKYLEDAHDQLLSQNWETTQRKEMTPEEIVMMGEVLFSMKRKRTSQRGSRIDLKNHEASFANLSSHEQRKLIKKERRLGEPREVIANAIGISRSNLLRAKKVVETANDPDLSPDEQQIAKTALDDMNSTGNIHRPYRMVTSMIPKETIKVADQSNGKRFDPIKNVNHQQKAIEGLVNSISGGTMGLEVIHTIHPKIGKGEVIRWLNDLSESRRVIESTIKRLRNHLQGVS